ncbi:MAG: hypothetical protein K2O89_04730 [Clostridia bacterium]|nr:hypothetical protein [Clostridia bacterium]
MNKTEITEYIRSNKGAEIAVLQSRYDVSYKEAKSVVDELIAKGELVYGGGVKYYYINKPDDRARRPKFFDKRSLFDEGRIVERLDRLRADSEEDTDEFDEDEEEELRIKALRYCIDKGYASVSLLQRAFPIGFYRACKTVEWMENEGYISSYDSDGKPPRPHKMLITEQEFESKFFLADCSDSEDEDSETDKKFEEYLRYVRENTEEIDCQYDNGGEEAPEHNSWNNEYDFLSAVCERIKRLICSDKKMGRQSALKKAEFCLLAVNETQDKRTIEVYERLVYEIKNLSAYRYAQLKKKFLS